MKRNTPLKRTGFKRKPKGETYALSVPMYMLDKVCPATPALSVKLDGKEVKLPKLPPIPRKRPKTTAIRKSAKGKPCLIRLPGCDGGGETTVLCHYRLAGYCGTGMKPPDSMSSFGCASCHAIVDGRAPRPEGYTRNDVLLAFAEGVIRMQELLRTEIK